jgi:hypothetical protein
VDDLDRLERDMRGWAKEALLLQSLGNEEFAALRQDLENVVLFDNGQFPQDLLRTAKSPMLLLNGLVAHALYSSFFRSPFFFLSSGDGREPSGFRSEEILEGIYERAQTCESIFVHNIAFH